jgi:hypothetical protein
MNWITWRLEVKNVPRQFYILALALLLYLSPLPYIFGDHNQRFILPVYVALQLLFVIACNKIVRENWIVFVTLIEAFCMTWNSVLFLRWHNAGELFYSAYSHVMFLALALEILIINLSMRGGEDERRNADRYPNHPIHNLFCRLNSRYSQNGRQEVVK